MKGTGIGMGAAKNASHEAKDNKRARAAAARERKRRDTGQWVWKQSDWLYLAAFAQALAKTGGALRIGTTRDGGALALGLYAGEDYATEYVKPAEDLETAVRELAGIWLDDGEYALDAELHTFQRTLPGSE